MNGVTVLTLIAVLVSVATVCLYILNEKVFKPKGFSEKKQALIFGIIFGFFSIMGTEFGVFYEGAVMNVRDAAPLCAALFFNPQAGIIAGLIGGIERWFAVYWGAGTFTRLACTLGTFFAGFLGAVIKKYLLDRRIPGIFIAFLVGTVAESFHMLMLYVTNTDEFIQAHEVLQLCAPVMIPLVAVSVGLAALLIKIYRRERLSLDFSDHGISQIISIGLLISVLVAFFITNEFQQSIQTKLAQRNAEISTQQTLVDIRDEVEVGIYRGDSVKDAMTRSLEHRHVGNIGFVIAVSPDGEIIAKTSDVSADFTRQIKSALTELTTYNALTTHKLSHNGADYYMSFVRSRGNYLMSVYPAVEVEFSRSLSVTLSSLLEMVILTVVFFMIYILIRRVVIKNLDEVNDDLALITEGELETVVDVRSSTEFAILSDDINQTVDTLKEYIEAAAARVDEELRMASDIQNSVLPRIFPDDNRFELYANMLPAKDVGGDFYDFYPVGDDKYAFLIADVSGKGIPAAMFMMNAKSLIKGIVETGASPGVAFTKANEKLCADNKAGMFITAWLAIMDLNTGHLVYANAGHNPPVIKKRDKTLEYLKSRAGFVLAGMEGIQYKDFEMDLEEGQAILLYTDGITEATDSNNQLFGEDRLIEALYGSGSMNMRYTCKHIKECVDEFVGEAPQFDDMTMLAFKRKNDIDRICSIVTDASDGSADSIREFFDKFIDYYELPFKLAATINVVVDEIYSNIIQYSGATRAVVNAEYVDNGVLLSFQDNGIPYNPLEKEDPDVTLSAEERKIGGLGIFMVKQMAEDVKYSRNAGKNILDVVIKK